MYVGRHRVGEASARRAWGARGASLLGVVASAAMLVAACGTSAGPNGEVAAGADGGTADAAAPGFACSPGDQGCPCSTEGATTSCARVHLTDGNYVTCSAGYSTCQAGVWGPCTGDHFYTASMPNVVMTTSGIHTLTATVACTNLCDINSCQSTQAGPSDVDAAGIVGGPEGGVTLNYGVITPGSSTGGGTATNCTGLACKIAACGAGASTTLSGTVYDPAGNNPLYNAYVYIPAKPTAALPAFGSGASCDTCGGAGALDALQATQTDAGGNFTLTNVPTVNNLPVVVQMGKWRREIVLKTISSCTNNTVTNNCTSSNPADCVFRLPRNHTDGYDPVAGTYTKADLPHIAIVTGSADPFDCLLLKTGIDPAEFGDYTSTKRFHFYKADTGGGDALDSAYGMNVAGSKLWNNLSGTGANMMTYDAILLPCQGGAYDAQGSTSTNTPYQNLITYADQGGRVFATHFSYSWLEYPAGKSYVPAPDNWSTVANWSPTGSAMTSTVDTEDPLIGIVNTNFPKGVVYSQWLQNLNATGTPGHLIIHEGRQDLTTLGTVPQSWMTAYDTAYPKFPNYTNLFTYNTPLGSAATAQCGRVVYSDFHVSASALVGSTNQCLSNADCGFTATCSGAKAGAVGSCNEPCGTSQDCPNGTYACNGATLGSCVPKTCTSASNCGTGETCAGGSCTCASNADCNGGSCTGMTCTPISCSSSSQCGNGTCGGGTCNSVSCHSNTDCGLGTCGGTGHTGTCSAGTACHADSACGIGGTCGRGTGSTAGTCSTSGQACHQNANCDSNSCGSGTGSKTGTCASSGQSCHSSATCDGACSGGTCSYGTGHACHANTDCDGSNCGSGAKGTCSIGGGTSCHKNTDCDSNSCGSGTGSTAGTCSTSGQSCTSGNQCDSGSCKSGKCTSKTCAGDSACGVSGVCNGAKCSTPAACSADTACTASHTCNGATCGAAPSCGADSTCTASLTCKGATCASTSCAGDAACGVSKVCNGATCSTASCSTDASCTASGSVCNGAKCSTSTCNGDSDCPTGTCTGAKCTPPASCTAGADCGTGGICTGAKCSASACSSSADCGTGSSCTGGTCQTATCKVNTDCVSGICNNGTCACEGTEQCGASQTCTGAVPGVCSRACTSNADCAPDYCVNGTCGGCTNSSQCHDNGYTASCGGIPSTSYGTCSNFSSNFPEACRQGTLSSQEKALEFMFFDLTSCVSPDNATPPAATITGYPAATFTQDFTASCPPQTLPMWREFDWQATVPTGSSIAFSAQSGATATTLLPTVPVALGTATATTKTGATMQNWDAALIDTGPKGTGAFDLAKPQVVSANLLRVTITLNPTSDFQQAPTLNQWKVQYDCVASE